MPPPVRYDPPPAWPMAARRFQPMLRRLLPLFVLVSCGPPPTPKAAAPAAVSGGAPVAAAPASARPVPPALPAPTQKALRVHIIGASVSGGFEDGPLTRAKEQGDSLPLQKLLEQWAGDDARVSTHNLDRMLAMFTDPLKIGREQMQGASRARPDVLVAIDFPFWFAYGHMAGDVAAARQQRLAAGLAMLDKLEMPILLGDLPDMHGAATRMLSARQIPEPELLQRLNEQLAEFVKAHPNMRLVPLARMVRTMKDEGASLPLATGALKTPPGALLQEDRLHATRLGIAFLGYALQEDLRAAFPAGHPLREQVWTFEQFVEAAGAEGELEQVAATARGAKAKAAGAGK